MGAPTIEPRTSRRRFLNHAAGLLAASPLAGRALAEVVQGSPPVTNPRATSGDTLAEPDWKERLTITVGPKKADMVGVSDKVIQAAVDYVARLGGGTVRLLPGAYRLRNAVHLQSGVRLLGDGAESVLSKRPTVSTKLAADSDWYDQEITLADARGFEVGDGVFIQTRNPHDSGTDIAKRTLVARSGNRFKLDRGLRKDFWTRGETTVSAQFSLLHAENVSDISVADLVLDGNRKNCTFLDGNYGACLFVQDCSRIAVNGVTARNHDGDGISWQICHDVSVRECHIHDVTKLGLHPGSGAQRPVIADNKIERCGIGIFVCWGIRFGLLRGNTIDASASSGISIGHRDTDNLICDNRITSSGKNGIFFRPERGKGYSADRNRVEKNHIIDNGGEDGIGIDMQGHTAAVKILNNEIRETRGPARRIGIRLGKHTRDIQLADNRIKGFSQAVVR